MSEVKATYKVGRLEDIRGNWEYGRCVKPEDVEWMVETIEKHQEELNHLNNMPLIKEYISMRDQLVKAQEENKRLKRALNSVKGYSAASDAYIDDILAGKHL